MTKESMADAKHNNPIYQGSAVFSYGFRPFFLGASVFAGLAVPFWILILAGGSDITWPYPARDWHVHEMIFGFLPAVMTGFLLTAIPNWTDRPPVRGIGLMQLFALWLAGRIVMAFPLGHPLVSAIVDGLFLVAVAVKVWREIVAAQAWGRFPIGFLVSLYALANILYHVFFLRNAATDLFERMALALIMVLLTLIGGRITPSFTHDFLAKYGKSEQIDPFSRMDRLSIIMVVIACVAWIFSPHAVVGGWMLVAAGIVNLIRLSRWYGWLTWREPLVLILHVGYAWLGISLFIVGGTILGLVVPEVDALHAVTTGAVGVMTLAVMTRATLGHTGRKKQADINTVVIYLLVNLGAILRLLASTNMFSKTAMLGLAAACWSGSYLLFVGVYGPMLLRPSLEEE